MKKISRILLAMLSLTVTVNAYAGGEDHRRLEMDPSSDVILGQEDLNFATKPAYPRLRHLEDGTYLLAWQEVIIGRKDDNGRYVSYALSSDLKKWTPMGRLFEDKTVTNYYGKSSERYYSCPEFLQLADGNLVAVCCFWNLSTYNKIEGRADNGLAVRISKDQGRSWGPEKEIFKGQSWEPFLIQQPDGRLQCYFSEARPWISSCHSGTSMLESLDGGETWSPALGDRPYRVMRKRYWNPEKERYQFTDQMPTGVILNDKGKMAFAMEDVDMGIYSLGIVYSPDDGHWDYLEGDDIGPGERIDSLSVNATGPYIVKFRSGEVLVTFTRNKGMEWNLMYRIGDADAKNWGPEHKAFDRGGWSSACVDSDDSVILVAPYKGGKLRLARFTLLKDNE